MITAITALLGFLSGISGPIIDYFKGARDNKHELAMLKTSAELELRKIKEKGDIEFRKLAVEGEMREVFELIRSTTEQQKALLKHDSSLHENLAKFLRSLDSSRLWRWLYNLICFMFAFAEVFAATVRPGVTAALVSVYGFVKLLAIRTEYQMTGDLNMAVGRNYGEEDMALMGYVLGFWFGQRMTQKLGFSRG